MLAAMGQGFLRTSSVWIWGLFWCQIPVSLQELRHLGSRNWPWTDGRASEEETHGGRTEGAVHHPWDTGLHQGGSLVQGGTEATRRRQEWRWPQKDHRIGEEPWRREGVGDHSPQRSRCGRKVWTFPCWHWGALEGFRAGHCQGQRGRVQKERAQPARQRRPQTW